MLTELFVADADRALDRLAAAAPEDIPAVTAPVSVERDEGPWLLVVDDRITAAIAAVDDDRLDVVTRAWADTDEWEYATADELAPLVRELRDVARQASPQRRLYLWICL